MKKTRTLGVLLLTTTALLALGAALGGTMARDEEQPSYTVDETHDAFEVRTYGPRVEARVTMAGSYNDAVGKGFRVLAGYIFGGNTPKARIDMTAPVTASAGARIAMTAPVSATPEQDAWTVAFMMPSTWTLQTLPEPEDPRIELAEAPGGTWAVRRFSGRARDARVARELATLRKGLADARMEAIGPETVAQFDPPWTLGPWRRNEVALPIRPQDESPER